MLCRMARLCSTIKHRTCGLSLFVHVVMTTPNKHDIKYYMEKLELFLLEQTYRGTETLVDMQRLLFRQFPDTVWPTSKATTHFTLTHATPINLTALHQNITEFMKRQVVRDFQINTMTLREDPTPRLILSWTTEMVSAAIGRKRKAQEDASASSSVPVPASASKKTKEEPGTCVDCKVDTSSADSIPFPEVRGLFRHAITDKGEWIMPREKNVALQELKLPSDTHEDLCVTLRRIYILTGLYTPTDLEVETSLVKNRLVIEVLNFSRISYEEWNEVAQFLQKQKAYRDILFHFESQRRSVLRFILHHSNAIFDE